MALAYAVLEFVKQVLQGTLTSTAEVGHHAEVIVTDKHTGIQTGESN